MQANDFVKLLLRSPFHGLLSRSVLLITLTGRRSGQLISVPVEYYQIGEELWITSRRERTWWRNLTGGAEVGLRLRGRQRNGDAELVVDKPTVTSKLNYLSLCFPRRVGGLGIRMEGSRPAQESLRRLAKERLIILVSVRHP
jgi:hypothetical protein